MNALGHDLRYGLRMLAKSPLVTGLAILSLSLGIGANTTIFSLVNAILLRPLPVHEPERLVTVFTDWKNDERLTSISYPDYRDFRDRNDVFTGTALMTYMPLGLKGADRPEVVLGEVVSGNYFEVVGVQPALGRAFLPEEYRTEGTHPVVVISYDAWQTRFGADPDIIGRQIPINSHPFTIIGVAPQGFHALQVSLPTDVWLTYMMQSTVAPRRDLESRGNHYSRMVGRLKPGVTIEQASAQLDAIALQLGEEYPDSNRDKGVALVETNRDRAFLSMVDDGALKLFMTLLLVVVGLVLLIACSNVANLLLARAMGRQKEIAIRVSFGAGRGRILRQLLTESALLAAISGLAGIGIAVFATGLIEAFEPPLPVPLALDLSPDIRVLAFTCAVSVITGLLFGLAPSVQTLRSNTFAALKDQRSSFHGSARKSRLQSSLVVTQVGLSLFLLVTAALCVRSLRNAKLVDVGFDPHNVVTLTLDLSMSDYDEVRGRQFFDTVIERAEAIPGVRSAGLISALPLGTTSTDSSVKVDGYEPAPTERMSLYNAAVAASYFETMSIPLLEGRLFDDRDSAGSRNVSVINAAMAGRYWPGQSAIGKSFQASGGAREVIGVVKTGKVRYLNEAPEPFYYLPQSQSYRHFHQLVLRAESDPAMVIAPLLRVVEQLDPNLPVSDLKTMEAHMGFALLPSQILGTLMGVFGSLALVLALVGVYGVMAHSVSQRMQEFGIRAALGARRWDIIRLVLRRGLFISAIGIPLGLASAAAATGALQSFLYGISALDPLTFGGVSVLLLAVVILSCYFPARRAANVDPMHALRDE